jgi:hypothetical protein
MDLVYLLLNRCTRYNSLRLRIAVCIRILEWGMQDIRNLDCSVNSRLYLNRWADRDYELVFILEALTIC